MTRTTTVTRPATTVRRAGVGHGRRPAPRPGLCGLTGGPAGGSRRQAGQGTRRGGRGREVASRSRRPPATAKATRPAAAHDDMRSRRLTAAATAATAADQQDGADQPAVGDDGEVAVGHETGVGVDGIVGGVDPWRADPGHDRRAPGFIRCRPGQGLALVGRLGRAGTDRWVHHEEDGEAGHHDDARRRRARADPRMSPAAAAGERGRRPPPRHGRAPASHDGRAAVVEAMAASPANEPRASGQRATIHRRTGTTGAPPGQGHEIPVALGRHQAGQAEAHRRPG